MQIVEWIVWGIAFFFAGSWLFGLIIQPSFRLKFTVTSVFFWWVEILVIWQNHLSSLHLLWLMPFTLLLPSKIFMWQMHGSWGDKYSPKSTGLLANVSITAAILVPILYLLVSN